MSCKRRLKDTKRCYSTVICLWNSFEFLSEGDQCSWVLNVCRETVPYTRSGSTVQGTAKWLLVADQRVMWCVTGWIISVMYAGPVITLSTLYTNMQSLNSMQPVPVQVHQCFGDVISHTNRAAEFKTCCNAAIVQCSNPASTALQ